MRDVGKLPLPLAENSERWVSVAAERTVLGVVHNITSATRLLDLLTVFEGDRRLQTVFTCTESSTLDEGTFEFFTSRGMLHIPWEEAISHKFDLAIATSRGGDLHNLQTPLIGAPHGAGYSKILVREAGSGKREAGSGKLLACRRNG
ncbi:hypothetical protein F9278_44905 [Streptomyces phaeolivaceus]|uniref:Uncharacterized protein n=1 Tax=Streptomyces phaeolivaceus TaxID=2653200 RepID=A0A5P8KH89_9ACTN|nr:hypothetical protein [Streptomyces phaeolivaceus]QFR02119.1 hypothetical protein F9278_44905 [Streptomyces phaeolivaceus]